jgi:hypothetical protein
MMSQEQQNRISHIIEDHGYKSGQPRESVLSSSTPFTDKDGRTILVKFWNECYELRGDYPIFEFRGERPTLHLRTELTDKTIKRRLDKFIEDFQLAHENALIALEEKQRAEGIAWDATGRIEAALKKPNKDYSKVEVTAQKDLGRETLAYTFRVSIVGSRTPQELMTIVRCLEQMGLTEEQNTV